MERHGPGGGAVNPRGAPPGSRSMTVRPRTPAFVTFVLATLSGVAAAQTAATAARPAEVVAREVAEETGAGRLGVQVMQQMIGTLKQSLTTVPDSFWGRF